MTTEVAKCVVEMLAKAGDRPVRAVRVTVGPRADLDAVRTTWTYLVAGSSLEDARVTFERTYDPMRCLACGREYQGSVRVACPACGGNGLPIDLRPDVCIDEEAEVAS